MQHFRTSAARFEAKRLLKSNSIFSNSADLEQAHEFRLNDI